VTVPIAGPDPDPEKVEAPIPLGACDCHAHLFGPPERFPYAEGRGYTPPDAPLSSYLRHLDALGLDRGVVVQGNAHGYDNRVILDAVARVPGRLRGVAITDASVAPQELHEWHRLGVRGLRFHFFHPDHRPGYRRGVGLDVFRHFETAMRELGWHMQVWCDHRILLDMAATFAEIGRTMPVVLDHYGEARAAKGVVEPSFQALLRLVGEGACWAKVSGAYRASTRFPDYEDAAPLHEALVAANPDRLVWGSDWPHPQVEAAVMPNDGHLLNLLLRWTPDPVARRKILVDNPARLYGFPLPPA
jgi:predicted TIM-barrel fold metal-dependent hydrolase